MPSKTKHMVRKASIGEDAPLAKQIKKEDNSESVRVILDSDKVELATKELAKIPKKGKSKETVKEVQKEDTMIEQVKYSRYNQFVHVKVKMHKTTRSKILK